MTSPNYEAMTTKELRTYVLAHRDDQNAINALANRVETNGVKLDSPEQLPDVIRRQQEQQE
ncbi:MULTISPECIES: hypothetical protein [Nostoc]|uniref:Uncharacterized protein n=1 Tax=Nostoc favosum CHAB5714 TaxID=2780399 RepID=A0ABS8IAL1_9NOSO|nr:MULTISPECIES: hypothetical protein [Nostoc]MCC5600844.1 hypothetical protein [Nostoc favosum CHAB5714]MCC5623442.1 hypothetical protein [Nostoc sp. CHAB 5715]